jgi:hypothetical protein
MDSLFIAPLQDQESSLPIVQVALPEVAFARVETQSYEVVRLNDSSRYEAVPMTKLDHIR